MCVCPGEGEQLPRPRRQRGPALLAPVQPGPVRHGFRGQDGPGLGRPDHQVHRHGQHQGWARGENHTFLYGTSRFSGTTRSSVEPSVPL